MKQVLKKIDENTAVLERIERLLSHPVIAAGSVRGESARSVSARRVSSGAAKRKDARSIARTGTVAEPDPKIVSSVPAPGKIARPDSPASKIPTGFGAPAKSEARQKEIRERREDAKRNGVLAKIVGGAMKGVGRGWDLAKGLLGMKSDVGEAAGLAAGGPFFAAVKEFADAVDVTRDNRFAKATMGFLAKRFKKEPPEKKEKGLRDSKGRFIKGAEVKSRRDESVEAIVAVKSTLEEIEKREVKRHKKLLKGIDDVDVGSTAGGGSGLLETAANTAILWKAGGLGAILGGIGSKILGKIPGGKFLAKGAGKLAGKLGLGAAGAAGGGILARGAGVVSKGVGAIAKGAGGLLGKIPGTGALAKGIGGLWGKAGGALAKTGGKSALKKIPVVGAMIGGGFAAKRLFGGDVVGAAGELASGLASIVPGLGTATSLAIDAGLAARDAIKADGKTLGESMAKVAEETLTEAEKEAARILENRDSDIVRAGRKRWFKPWTWFQKDETEPSEVVATSGDLGHVSERYESGGRGVGTISDGRGDAGGVSYGRHQLASKTGTMAAFLRSKEAEPYADRFRGMEPGSAEFNRVYEQAAKEDPEGFAKAQHAFIRRTHFDPVANYAKARGLDVANPAIQEALWSQAVQHSGQGNIEIIDAAVARTGKGAGTEETVNALYDARGQYASQYASPAATTERYARERKDVLAIAREPDVVAAKNKETKKSLQPSATRGRMETAQAIEAPMRARMPAVKPVEPPQPVPRLAPRQVEAPRPNRREGRVASEQKIPTEFDDTLLALISADRI